MRKLATALGAPVLLRMPVLLGITVLGAWLLGPGLGERRANAENVNLKNGYSISGWIVEEDADEIVLIVIERDSVGTIRLRTTDVKSISRERKESLESALNRFRVAKKEREAHERRMAEKRAREAKAAADSAGESGKPADGSPGKAPKGAVGAAEGADASEEKGDGALKRIVAQPSKEEEKEIQAAIYRLGASRAQGSGFRRQAAMNKLVAIGAPSTGKVTEALGDSSNAYRRMNAAIVLGRLAGKDSRLGLYVDAVPALTSAVGDPIAWVRHRANEALEAISGQRMGKVSSQRGGGWSASSPAGSEREVITKWQAWWKKRSKAGK